MKYRIFIVKPAHFLLNKYGIIPLEMNDKVLFKGKLFEIQGYSLSQEYFKTELKIELCDCHKFL